MGAVEVAPTSFIQVHAGLTRRVQGQRFESSRRHIPDMRWRSGVPICLIHPEHAEGRYAETSTVAPLEWQRAAPSSLPINSNLIAKGPCD
jgi:hypothetical protein